jgi:ParB/RepB/Spo0J family partition protein
MNRAAKQWEERVMTTNDEMKAGERYGALLAVRELTVAPWNARRATETDEVNELAASIQQDGLLQPLVVRIVAGKWEVICGARRLAAVRSLGWESVQCWVVDESDARAKVMNLTENVQRRSLAPLDEAEAFAQLRETEGLDVYLIAAEIGKATDPGYVAQRMRLCHLIPTFKEALASGRIGVGVALLAARIPDEHQKELASLILRTGESAESFGVRYVRDWIARHHMRLLKEAPWATRDETYRGEALSGGACEVCPKQTGTEPLLFPELTKGKRTEARCLDATCWKARTAQIIRIETMADESLIQLDGQESWKYRVSPNGTKRGIFISDGYADDGIVAGTCVQFEFARSGGDDAETFKAKAKREAKKARTTRAIRLQVLAATVRSILTTGYAKGDVQNAVRVFVARMVNDDRRFLCKALGLEVQKGGHGGSDFEKTVMTWIEGMNFTVEIQYLRLFVVLAVACHGARADATADLLMDAARRQKVDVASITASVQGGSRAIEKTTRTKTQKAVHEGHKRKDAKTLGAAPVPEASKKKRARTKREDTKTGTRVTKKLKKPVAARMKKQTTS